MLRYFRQVLLELPRLLLLVCYGSYHGGAADARIKPMAEMPDHFHRTADELELSLLEMPVDVQIALMVEVTARILAQAEAFPDRRFLTVLQKCTLAILSEEDCSPWK